HARWGVPICSPPIAEGVVVVDRAEITYVGDTDGATAGPDVDLGDALLMPGLVNAHTHLELTAMRGFLEDLDFRRWILRLTHARRAVLDRDALLDYERPTVLDRDALLVAALYGLEEGLRAGITSYADTSESGVVMQAMREAG